MKPKQFVILDLDNCISNDGWRFKHIDWRAKTPDARYHDYHLLAGHDAVGNTDLISGSYRSGREIIVMTARPITYRAITQHWLDHHGITVHSLLMRNNNDRRSSVEVKKEQLRWLLSHYGVDKEDIVHAYDDRQDIVDMYVAAGIPATRRWIHDQCAMTKPEAA